MKAIAIPFSLLGAASFILLRAAHATEDDNYRDNLYKSWEDRKALVFVAQCGERSGSYAAIFHELGNPNWELIEESEGTVVNLGGFSMVPDRVGSDLETNGGMYSYSRVRHLIRELIASGFDFLYPFTVEKLRNLKIRKPKCRYDGSVNDEFFDPVKGYEE